MKKIILISVSVIAAAICAVIIFMVASANKIDLNDSSKWVNVSHSEFSVKLPEALESSTQLYSTSLGTEQIACYSKDEVFFSVAKKGMSSADISRLDLKTYLNNLTINGEPVNPVEVNGGYYYRAKGSNSSGEIFRIDAIFKNDSAVYSVSTGCPALERTQYEESMIKWIESFYLN